MGRIGKMTIEEALRFIEGSPHAVTRPQVQKHIGRNLATSSAVIKRLTEEGRIQMLSGTDSKGHYMVLYWAQGFKLVPPPGVGFKPAADRKKDEMPKHSPFAEMRRRFGEAKQIGVERPWYISCLFGDPNKAEPA